MKKFLSILLCSLLVIPLSGCSNKLLEVYPEIEQDFDKSDYDALTELSKDYSLSYEEIKENYAVSLLPDFKKSVEDNDLGVVTLENIFSDNEYSYVIYSVEKEMDWGNPTANLTFKIDKENNINSIEYAEDDYFYGYDILNVVEGNKPDNDSVYNIYKSMNRDMYIENKIYKESENFYYTPSGNGRIILYTNIDDIPDEYVSFSKYSSEYDFQAEKDLENLRDNIQDVEDAFNTMDDAMKASN